MQIRLRAIALASIYLCLAASVWAQVPAPGGNGGGGGGSITINGTSAGSFLFTTGSDSFADWSCSSGSTICFNANWPALMTRNNVYLGRQDASGASSTAPNKTGTSLPGSCAVGDTYFKSDATAGQNIYGCTSVNTWTLTSGGGGREISFGICAATNCAVNDTISIPRLISSVTAGTLQKCSAIAGTGPTGTGSLSIQVKKNGTTTATVSIAASATTGSTTTFSSATLAEGDYLTLNVSVVGGTTPGKDVNLICVVQ